jgi:lambda family phage tail tape measure protein
MATTNAQINVSVNGLSSLDTLEKKLTGITAKFAGLKTKLAAVGLAAFGRSAIMMADDLNDLSAATGIAIGRLIEYKDALMAAGGQADTMAMGVVKFTQSIDEAAQGSLKAQNSFAELGITLNDLKTLSEEDLLTKALDGFSNITDKSREAALKMDLFGKSFKTVDPREMSDKLKEAAGTGDKYAQSIKAAAELNDKMAKSATDLKIAFLQVTAPIVDLINKISDGGQNIERLTTVLKVLGTILLAVFGGGIAMAVVRFFGMFARGIAAVGPALSQVSKLFSGFGSSATTGAAVASKAFAPTSSLMTALRGVLTMVGTVGGAVAGIFGLGGGGETAKPAGGSDNASKKESDATREVTDALAKKRLEIENITKSFKQQNSQLIDNINVEKMLVGKSQEEAEIIRAQEEIYKRGADEIEKLRDAKALLSKDEAGLIPIYDAQIKKIQENTNATAAQVKTSLEGLQGLKLLEQDRVNNIQRITDALEKQKKLDESILQIRQSTQGQLNEAAFEKAQMGRNPLEKQFAQIQESARKAALEAGRAFSEQFNMEDISAADAKKLADGLDLIAQKYKEIADAQSANLAISRTWEQGWADAFNSYMDNATNAAQRAGEAFSSITGNMNSAIDKFVTTGKFSFSDFARSIIQDLLKIELKAQATALFKSAAGGLGGLLSGIGSIFGFADGGSPPINKPSIVGERGPELFVPKTAGTVIPNNAMGGGQQVVNNNYVYNVSAIDAKSVATFFAENRKTMLGTIQMAQKELPYGNR